MRHCGHHRPIVHPHMIYEYGEPRWNDTERENGRTRRKACPCVTLSTTKFTWTDPDANPGFRGERPATSLSNGTAFWGIV